MFHEMKQSMGNSFMYQKLGYLLFEEGFNILFYGVGCKQNLIDQLQNYYVSQHPVMVVNGLYPKLYSKDILYSIACKLVQVECKAKNKNNIFASIRSKCENNLDIHYFLIIQSFDYHTLNSQAFRLQLSRIATIKNIHLIVTIDRPLHSQRFTSTEIKRFNFLLFNTSSFLSYDDENLASSLKPIQSSQRLIYTSLSNVFASLTLNSRKVLLIIIKAQLESNTTNARLELSFKDLYQLCREKFLVSSDLALRALLTELVDHSIVKHKRANDGSEYLSMPIENKLLKHFISDIEESNSLN